ncbi:unnamed protein product [Euphydryas editha]|uniref:Uncharacterized protein n=1 Tax=Euphydryas editha TaxID=104508 RepID=A0AAU9THQ1_EUPED|nr:unnamed protein product [Euphydryas editha]
MGTALPGALLSLDRFTVLQGSAPASVRATYGPFSTKQTVPARYAVPDPLEPPRRNATLVELQDATAHRLDVSAHLVFRELPKDAPVLRVLFHTGGEGGARRAAARPRRVCITLHASLGTKTLTATCGPEGEEGACLAELTVPAAWWPADGKGKRPPRNIKLAYSAAEASSGETGEGICGKVSVQPAWPLGTVTLSGARAGYRETRAGDTALLLPRAPLYPHFRLHLPFVIRRDTSHAIGHVVIRDVEENTGAGGPGWEEILTWLVEVGAEGEGDAEGSEGESGRGTARISWSAKVSSSPSATSTTEETPHEHRVNTRLDIEKDDIQAVLPISKVYARFLAKDHDSGRVSYFVSRRTWLKVTELVLSLMRVSDPRIASLRDRVLQGRSTGRTEVQVLSPITENTGAGGPGWEEILTWLVEVGAEGEGDAEGSEGESGRGTARISWSAKVSSSPSATSTTEETPHEHRVNTRLDIEKDDIQAVLPISKVSSSCSSVYVDGSEIRGSSNASVIVKYGTYTGLARFTVWMPEYPLEIDVDDNRLSQIKGMFVLLGAFCFAIMHIIKAPPIDVFNAPIGSAGVEDSTVDAPNSESHIYENVCNGNVAPTKMLCDSIAHKNNFMKIQLKFLLEHLSEAYE